MAKTVYLTLGQVAKRLGCHPWQVRRIFEENRMPEPPRAGAYRLVAEEDVATVEKVLREKGYIK